MRKSSTGNLVHDYNGEGRWSVAAVQTRYLEYCREYGLESSGPPVPREHVEGQEQWVYPVMEAVIEGIERGDKASIALGLEFTEYFAQWKPNESGWLFATRLGTPWDQNLVVKRKLYPLLDSLGIERGGLHAFRHANITLMDRLGVPLKLRQQRVGHSEGSLTLDVYTHVVSEDDVLFAERLGGILRPNAPKKENGSGLEHPKPLYLN